MCRFHGTDAGSMEEVQCRVLSQIRQVSGSKLLSAQGKIHVLAMIVCSEKSQQRNH